MADVLALDQHVQFKRADDGPWTLRDKVTGKVYRSGQDDTPPTNTDTAYLGRLPRPAGDGSLIVFTGIHPQGSLGVVQMLTTSLSELYSEVKTNNFAALVGTEYDPDANEPRHVELLTPLYRMDA